MKKVKVWILIMALLFSLTGVLGCDAKPEESQLKLDTSHGIGNQAYLYGMCYNIYERNYAGNPNYDYKKEIKLMANLGVTSVRNWMHITYLLTDPQTVNQARAQEMHEVIAEYQRYGMQVVGMSHTSFHDGSYLTGKPARNTDPESYYVQWLNDYYTSWKTLVAEFPEITLWEIDNEMNNPDFMCTINGEKIYTQNEMAEIATDMLYYASRAIHEANPNAKTIMGGLTEPHGLGSGQNKSFLQKVYENIHSGEFGYFYGIEDKSQASKNPDDYFEIACWHPYIGGSDFNRENFIKFNNEIYQVILDYEGKHKKVMFTEIGFNDTRYGEENAALFIEQMYDTVKEEMPYVEAIHYFKLLNVATIGWTGTVSRFGLFYDPDPNRQDYNPNDVNDRYTPGAPKQKAYSYQRVAGGKGDLTLIQIDID